MGLFCHKYLSNFKYGFISLMFCIIQIEKILFFFSWKKKAMYKVHKYMTDLKRPHEPKYLLRNWYIILQSSCWQEKHRLNIKSKMKKNCLPLIMQRNSKKKKKKSVFFHRKKRAGADLSCHRKLLILSILPFHIPY